MEQNHSLFRIFIIIMLIEFVITFLIYSKIFIPFTGIDVQDFQIYSYFVSLITFIINPILVLIIFYKLGKKLDLKSNHKSVIVRLVIGAYLGHFFSITLLYFGFNVIKRLNYSWVSYLSHILSVSFIGLFFASFTALAIAYFRHHD